ncbi:MAG: HTTM domain-containing protein [Bacteroidetes bacterium]|nr:HTTM domain-containing protein [Bacteroidota bacterium]
MQRLRTYLTQPISIAPLATFRILFGAIMFVSVVRFMLRGWVTDLYVEPKFFFSYYGFEWVKPLGEFGMYAVFAAMALATIGIALGAFYRISAITFFLTWTYVELLDVTNYLNHYYFVSLAAFLLMLVPANRYLSVDVWRRPAIKLEFVPRWMIGALRMQMGIVYVFAGIAKINGDWLLRAQPLKIWLASRTHLPVIGWAFKYSWTAFAFSWMGCLYDLTVPFFLLWRKTRPFAYAAVIGFHLLTWWLFPIGMFPFIMILGTLVFFPGEWHLKWQSRLLSFATKTQRHEENPLDLRAFVSSWPHKTKILPTLLTLHLVLQILIPFRYLLYPENLFWHEQGFRFSWRVMLMEKAGYAVFHVRDPETGKSTEVINREYLRPNQERMMSTQPDLILQFAHFLEDEYKQKGIADPEVYAEVHATLNGSGSRPFTNPNIDLTQRKEGFAPKDWILPFESHSPTFGQEDRR